MQDHQVVTVSSTDVLSTSSTDYVTGEGTVLERVVQQRYTQDGADTTLQTKTECKLLHRTTHSGHHASANRTKNIST